MKEPSIRLHPEKGLNPRLCICPWCGEDNGEIALVGVEDKKYKCRNCGQQWIGKRRCPNCEVAGEYLGRLEEGEKLTGGLCDKCKEKEADMIKAVEEGGIYWKCEKCGSTGAFSAKKKLSTEISGSAEVDVYPDDIVSRVRKALNVPDGPCGITFNGDCPVCQGLGPKD